VERDRSRFARITRYSPLNVSVSVDTATPGFLVVTDAYFPGWHAYRDGVETPILRGDSMFRTIEIPAGSHNIVFRYEPSSVMLGVVVSLLMLSASFGYRLVSFWFQRRRGQSTKCARSVAARLRWR
jgi:uncharacterized membrane protein YfhO